MSLFEDLEPEDLEFKLENADSVEDIHYFLVRNAEEYESDFDEVKRDPENSIASGKPELDVSPKDSLTLELTGRDEIIEYLESVYTSNTDKEEYELFN